MHLLNQVLSLLMQCAELFSSFVQLNLCCLSLGHFEIQTPATLVSCVCYACWLHSLFLIIRRYCESFHLQRFVVDFEGISFSISAVNNTHKTVRT